MLRAHARTDLLLKQNGVLQNACSFDKTVLSLVEQCPWQLHHVKEQSATRLRVLNLVTTFFKLGVVKARLGDVSKRPWVRHIRADGMLTAK